MKQQPLQGGIFQLSRILFLQERIHSNRKCLPFAQLWQHYFNKDVIMLLL